MDAIDVVFPGASRLRNLESERQSDTEHFWLSINERIQESVSWASLIRERNGSITDASCGFKPNCKCSHYSDNYWRPEFISQTKPWIVDTGASFSSVQMHDFHPRAVGVAKGHIMTRNSSVRCPLGASFSSVQMHDFYPRAVGVAKGHIIKRNSSVRCPLVKMLLFGKGIKVPVSWHSLILKTRYLKRNGTFHRCSSLLILAEAPTKKKTVANGNGKGADNGSSEEVSSYQANDGLNASTETPISQSERSSISSVRCPLVKMLLFGKGIKVPVSWHSLILKTRYLKRNGTFHRCSSLLILAEAPTKKKTVANGNGKGADNGSSEEVSSYQANDGLNASTETPISQSERSSISSPDETATVDISSIAPTRTLESTWYIASAAAHHMTGVQDLLTNYTPLSEALDVHTPNMGRMQVLGSGSVNTTNITLQDVWFVPGLDANLVSTNQLTKLGHRVSLGPSGCRINKDSEDGALIGSAHFTDDYLFKVDFLNVEPTN